MQQRITIIGSGAMGTLCALVLSGNGHKVTIWGKDKQRLDKMQEVRENQKYLPGFKLTENIYLTSDIRKACIDKHIFISAVPTQHIRSVCNRFAPYIPRESSIISVAKGIEKDTLLLPTEIIEDVLGKVDRRDARPAAFKLAALSGPAIALEIAQKKPATLLAASVDNYLSDKVQKLFTTNYLRVYTDSDILGTQLAGATKNVIALAAGMLDGLNAGINAKSALLARGLAEIARLGQAMGAKRDTFFGVAGVGDLATTCFSPTGRNRSCGELLGKGYSLNEALEQSKGIVEGVDTAAAVMQLARRYNVDMPITGGVNSVLFEDLKPAKAIDQLMSRKVKHSQRIGSQ